MFLVIAVILGIIILILEFTSPVSDSVSSAIGFSVMKYFGVMFYLYIVSIYATELKLVARINVRRIIYCIVGVTCILILSMGNVNNILGHNTLLTLSVMLLGLLFIGGDQFFQRLFKMKSLDEGEIEKAFLTYPPKGYSDFMFFFIFVAIFLLMPSFVKMIWANIILKQ